MTNPYRSAYTHRDVTPTAPTTHGNGRRGVPFVVDAARVGGAR